MSSGAWSNQVVSRVIIAGPNGQLLIYAPTVGAGNLVGSISSQNGIDAYGNHYVGGEFVYGAATGIGFSVGTNSLVSLTGSLAAGWVIATIVSNDGTNTFIDAAGTINLRTLAAVAGAPVTVNSSSVSLAQADISTNAVGNSAAAGELTKLWSVPANDGVTGTTYTIRALAVATTGNTTIETLTIGADINNGVSGGGTLVPLATLGTAFNGGALSTTYAIPLELVLIVNAAGVSTPEIYLNGPLGDTSANRLSTNSANMSGFSHVAAWNPTNLNTLSIYAVWGGAGGTGQNIQTIASRLYREGP